MRFNFVGSLSFNDLASKNPYIKEGKTKSGDEYKTFSFAVVSAKNNRAWVERFGAVKDTIKSWDDEGNELNIEWDDRMNKDIVDKVPSFRKCVYSSSEGRNEFISEYDFIEKLNSDIEILKDKNKRWCVVGDTQKNVYNGTISTRFRFSSVYELEEDDERKNQLLVTGEFFFNKDSLDLGDWKEEKKIRINGYTLDYINSDEGKKYTPFSLMIDCGKLDLDEKRDQLNGELAGFNLKLDDNNKVVYTVKNTKYFSMNIQCRYSNGASEVDFDEKQLSKFQKELLKSGRYKIEDFQPTQAIYGNREIVYKFKKIDVRAGSDWADGPKEIDTASDFEDNIYYPPKDEKIEDVLKKEDMNPPEDGDGDDFDLFED